MSNHSINPGGLKEAKEYMMGKEIPQLFEVYIYLFLNSLILTIF